MADAILSFGAVLSTAHLVLIALVAGGIPLAAQESALEPEQARLLEKAREVALHYEVSLPDFLCTQVVSRWQGRAGSGRTRLRDRLTVKLSYVEHREDYKLMEINGQPTLLEYLYVGGALSTGEFGTRLNAIFHPGSHGEFRWKGWTRVRNRRVARFAFRIAQEHSTYRVQVGDVPAGPYSIIVSYHGEVFVDADTHMVLRLTEAAEIPRGFPMNSNESTVDYDFAEVGGKPYLLPTQATAKTRKGNLLAENHIEFREYRKFQSETTIRYASPVDK